MTEQPTRADDTARRLVTPQPPDFGIRQGILKEWNPGTGENVVDLDGTLLTDLSVQAAGTVAMTVGDVVALLRKGYSYFIVGVIRTPPAGSMAVQGGRVLIGLGSPPDVVTSSTFVSPATFGPQIIDVYVGPSRKCLVTISAVMGVIACTGYVSFSVNGASTINAAEFRGCMISSTDSSSASVTKMSLLTAADGLNEGLHTFTVRVRRDDEGTGPVFNLADRDLIIQPY